jgi:hypothetical protein
MIIGIAGKAGSGKDLVAEYLVDAHEFTRVALADPMKRFVRCTMGVHERNLWGPSLQRSAMVAPSRDSLHAVIDEAPIFTASLLSTSRPEVQARAANALVLWYLREVYAAVRQGDAVSLRHVLQTLGTEWGRESVHPEIWLEYHHQTVLALCKASYDPADGVIPASPEQIDVVVPDIRFRNEVDWFAEDGAVLYIERPDRDRDSLAPDETAHVSEQLDASYEGISHVIVNDGTEDDLRRKVWTLLDPESAGWAYGGESWTCGACEAVVHNNTTRCDCGAPKPSKPDMPPAPTSGKVQL